MDALALLKADHRTLEGLFRRLEKAGPKALKTKQRLKEQLVRELSVHTAIEEEYFYPAVRARAEPLKEEVLLALEEHHAAKWTLKELERLPVEHERFDAKLRVLARSVRRHLAEEERELFARVRKSFTPQELRYLGEMLERAKQTAPTHPHPQAPDTPPANLVTDTLSAVLDLGRDTLRSMRRRVPVLGRRPAMGNGHAREEEAHAPA